MTAKQQAEKEKTLQKFRDLCRLQHKAWSTEKGYGRWIALYIDWLAEHGRDLTTSEARMQAFLTAQTHRGVSRATQKGAFDALLFLYEQVRREKLQDIRALRPKQLKRLRQPLPRKVTLELLSRAKDHAGYPTKMILHLLYACGLRVTEPLKLRVKDIDVENSRILIIGAKGGKDRLLRVPCWLMAELLKQLKRARAIFEADQVSGVPIEMEGLLAAKYKRAPFSWQWAWVFPGHRPCIHPRTKQLVRYRMHECFVQRTMQVVARAMGLESWATPHVLRHCCASHMFDAGANPRDVQEFLGHSHLDTTMVYVQPQSHRLVSPLETPPALTMEAETFEQRRIGGAVPAGSIAGSEDGYAGSFASATKEWLSDWRKEGGR